MITDYKEIQDSALELDENHRAELAKKLIDSLDRQIDDDVEQAWIDEVQKRKESLASGKASLHSAADVLKEARKRL